MLRRFFLWALTLSFLGGAAFGCGGSQETRVITAFTAEHEPVFENGMDMVRDPESLEGAWLGSWEDELDARVTLADAVVLATVRTIRHDTDLDRRETYRLVLNIEREYVGEAEDEETLVVREGDAGFGTIEGNEDRILDEQFIGFLKWQEDDVGEVRIRWHLAQATDQVATRVRDLLARRRQVIQRDPSRRRVVVHRN